MIKQFLQYFLFLSFFFCLLSCDTNEPPPPDNGNGNGNDKPKPKITLTVDDTSPTEVWLNLTTENISLPDTLIFIRDNDTVKTIELFDSSYVIYEDSLLPSQSYTYQVSSIGYQVTSEQVSAVTMDTTSHNFSWEVFEFGEHGNSILRDVAIIDENNIWAVGAIYLKDSTGANDSKLYNAVHWNGNEWQPLRIVEEGFLLAPEYSIYAITADDIWVGGSIPQHWDGNTWTFWGGNKGYEGGFYINKIWAKSSDEVYLVGGNGNIRYYNGTSWRKIESGTELTLSDVYGANTGEVYVSGVDIFKSGILLKGNSFGFSVYKNAGYISESELFETLYGELGSTWVDEKGTIYTAGSYLYWERRGKWNFVESLPENYYQANIGALARGYISSISGNASNDIVIAGGRNTLIHFNGISWQQIGMEYSPNNPIIWYSVEQLNNLVLAVGFKDNKAIIIKLKR